MYRIEQHPILDIPDAPVVEFFYNGKKIQARKGYTIAAALHQAGYPVHSHSIDGKPRSLECGIGKCGACEMLVDGQVRRICITSVDGVKEVREIPKDYMPEGKTRAASETKVYDGYELSNDGYTVSSEAPSRGLVEGHTIRSIIVEGAQTDANASSAEEEITPNNMIRDAEIIDASGTDVTENYAVNYVGGALKVVKKPITITAESAEKVYDGGALTAEGYTTTGLADGDVLDSVTVTGSQTLVGMSDNVPSDVKIVRPAPTQDDPNHVDDVNGNYDITYVNGTLKVTAQTLTITADSADSPSTATPPRAWPRATASRPSPSPAARPTPGKAKTFPPRRRS